MVKIDSEGELIWQRIYEDVRGAALYDVVETSDGGFAVAGYHDRYVLFRFDYAGELLWYTACGYSDAYSLLLMEDGGYLLGGFAECIGCWLVRTEPDPTDLPIELSADRALNFGEVVWDSVSIQSLKVRCTGRRFGDIDSVAITEGADAFSCRLDSAIRLFPKDSLLIPVSFQPRLEGDYTGLLHIYYGSDTVDDTIEITLSGRGIPPSGVSDFILQPLAFGLDGVYPNPFNSTTTVNFTVNMLSHPVLRILTPNGCAIRGTTDLGWLRPGSYQNRVDFRGLPSGSYLIEMKSGGLVSTKSVTLIK
jgi:hypothetical protein